MYLNQYVLYVLSGDQNGVMVCKLYFQTVPPTMHMLSSPVLPVDCVCGLQSALNQVVLVQLHGKIKKSMNQSFFPTKATTIRDIIVGFSQNG